jgi:membrane protein
MVFLNWIDDFLEKAGDIIGKFFNIIWAFLCSIIYGLITGLFNIFDRLTNMDLLDQSNININGIYQRMTMIITIIMIFYITFEFVKYVLQPDTINDKEKGVEGIIKRIVIAILLIAFIPTVFTTAMKLQDRILDTNIIPKVIFGQKDFDYKNAGSNFAGDVFAAFYRVNYEECTKKGDCNEAKKEVERVVGLWKERNGLEALITAQGKQLIDITNTSVQFDGLLAVIFGCFTLYVIFLYCIDLGVRFVQLLFLQIIAPVAAISYIIPQKDSMLNKWIKQVTTTYLDVFIRYAVLYFMLLIVSILSSSMDFYELSRGEGKQIDIIMYIFIIMGLLIFVQRAPKLIEELFPKSSGAASIGFGFSGKSRFEPLGKTISSFLKPTAATAGMVAGATKGVLKKDANGKYRLNKDLVKNIKGNKFKDILARGATYATSMAKAGYQGAKTGAKTGRFSQANLAAQQSVQKDEAIVNKGGSVLGATFRGTHYQEVKADIQVKIDALEAMAKTKKAVSSAVEDLKIRKQMDSIGAAITASGDSAAAKDWEGVKKGMEKAARNYAAGNITEGEYKSNLEKIIEKYNAGVTRESSKVDVNLVVNDDSLELNKDGKWSSIKTAMGEALKVAKEIKGTEYDDGKAIEFNDSEFADNIGDITDNANAAINRIKASDKYKEADTNASEGKK